MHSKLALLLFLLIISILQVSNSRGGRGGGGRGGGIRRSGSSRSVSSGSRSGASGMIGSSSRYVMWTSRHNLSPGFRYRTSSYHYKSNGIHTGMIIISPHYRRTFVVYRESSYDDIEICYNEGTLYGRNVSASPWFVCPWEDISARYCCGDEIEQRCCLYFERPGHLAGLIIGFLLIIGLTTWICYYCCCKRKKSKDHEVMIYLEPGKNNNDEIICETRPLDAPGDMSYPPYPIDVPVKSDSCPPYPQSDPYGNQALPYPTSNNLSQPYPQGAIDQAQPPYPIDPTAPSQGGYPPAPTAPGAYPTQPGPMGYDHSGPTYSLIPPENPPPAYSDIVRQQ